MSLVGGRADSYALRDTSNVNILYRSARQNSLDAALNTLRKFEKVSNGNVVYQTIDDFLESNISDGLFIPNRDWEIKGDVSKLFDKTVYESLRDFLITVYEKKYIDIRHGLVHAPAAEWIVPQVSVNFNFETDVDGLFVVGDGSGKTQGILCRAPIVQLMREDAEGNRVRRPRRRLRAGRSAVASVRRMLLSRANGRYVSCLLLSVPVAVSVFVAANTVLSSIAVVNPRPEYELRVTQMRENEQGGWFTEEDRSAIRALSGVRDVQLSSVVTARKYENGEWRNDDGDGSTINRIYVYLSDISRYEAVEKWLRDTYAGQEYSVVNEYAEYERTEVAFVGLLWLLLVFLLVLLVLEAMVVSARLTGFVLAQRGNLRRLYGLGASAGTLIRAYSGQAERAAAWGIILTAVPSAALLLVLNKSEMYFLDLRPGVLAMNLGCAALLALSYILPVRLALKKAMRGIRAEER